MIVGDLTEGKKFTAVSGCVCVNDSGAYVLVCVRAILQDCLVVVSRGVKDELFPAVQRR